MGSSPSRGGPYCRVCGVKDSVRPIQYNNKCEDCKGVSTKSAGIFDENGNLLYDCKGHCYICGEYGFMLKSEGLCFDCYHK